METYRAFLGSRLAELKHRGNSYRSIAKRCQIASPNFLQQVVRNQRNLTEQTARKVADGLKLSAAHRDYFLALVQLDQATDPIRRQKIERKITRFTGRLNTNRINDHRLFKSWLPGVIFESSRLLGEKFSANDIQHLNRNIATKPEISRALDTLIKRGCFAINEQLVYRRMTDSIASGDDNADENIRDNHIKFLDFAKQRVKDPVQDKEFQGLTLAIPSARFSEVKERIRSMLDDLDASMVAEPNPNQLIHVEVAAFKILEVSKC